MVSAPRPRRWRRLPAALAFVVAAIAAATVHLAGQGPLVPGANVNMVRGTAFVGGDPFLQRQNEPSLAISTRNPCHLLAGANDYRTVDFPDPTPLPNEEGVTQAPAQNPRDAWLGVYTSTDCGSTWRSALLPGHPFDTSAVGLASPNRGFTSAADPVVRAGTNGLFFYAGLVFDRADTSRSQVFVSRFIDNNNRERGETIEYIDGSVVDVGDPDTFVDKPWVAVDQPRAGALMCDINGQRFPAGRVYVAWARFEGGGSRIMLSRSADCGRTWQAQALSDTAVTNQGASIAIAPHDGSVHVAWRQFGRDNLPATIQIATSRNGGATFTRATVASPINAFDQAKLENRRFRTNSLPTVAADHLNRVYVAWAERGFARASGRTNVVTGDARIVLAVSTNAGLTFAPRYPIDDTLRDADGALRFGHQVMPSLTFTAGKLQAIYYDFSDDLANVFNEFVDEAETPPVDPNNPNVRRRHTVDVRAASAEPAAQPVFLPVLVTPQGTSPRLSHYRTIVDPDGTVRQVQFNPPNLPLFVGGTIPFIGDYIDVAGLGFVPYQGAWRHNNGNTSGPRFDGAFPSTPAFHAVWTDHRDVKAPADGDWTLYKAPGDPFWKMPGSECVPDRAGMRNANIYTARLTNGLYAGSPGNTKPLGFQRHPQTAAVIVDPTTGRPVHMQRSFVVFVQNSLQVTTKYLMRIVNQPGALQGDRASFLRAPAPPFSNADLATRPYIWLVATVPPQSTISRTVFVTSANERAMVRVDILEVAPTVPQGIGNLATTAPPPLANGRRATVLLNPDPTNPTIIDPDFVSPDVPVLAEETHDPEIFDPVVTTIGHVRSNAIELRNPDEANPDEANPDEANIDEETPDEANPDEANPDEANPDEANPDEANPDEANAALRNTALSDDQLTTAHVVDVQWKVKNNGNTTTSFRFSPTFSGARIGKHFQLLVTKRYYVPAVDGITCELGVRRNNQVIVNVPGFDPLNPDEANPDEANPDEANPDEANPDEANPDEANPDEANATFFLAPGETATATLRVYDLTTATEPPPAVLATFEETASAVVQSQAPNTGEAVPPRDVAGADLVPINALASPANAAPGTNAQISWTLANRGTEPTDATSFRTRFMFSTDREISENDTELAVVTFSGTVPPDDPSTPTVNEGELPQTTTVTIPPGATTGLRFILLVTDSLNEVAEADEANNAAAAELIGAQALAFVGQPTNTTQGFRFATPVSVAIVPIAGVPPTVAFVNLAVASGPAGATLSGTLTAPNVGGVATFTDLTLLTPGTYTLLATGTGVEGLPVFAAPAISAAFTVAVDAPPVAMPDNYSVAAGGILTVGSESENRFTANDTDAIRSGPGIAPPGRALLASLVQTTQFGTLTFNAFGGFVYQPVSGFDGIDFFTYRLNDGVAFGNTTTVRIAVGTGEGNAAPVTRPLTITVAEDSVNTAIDVVAVAIDADGDALSIVGASGINGTALIVGGVLRYSPDSDFSGSDEIEYVITDGHGGNTPGVVTVTVTPVNDNPVAIDDGPFTVPVNAPATGFPVLVNDTDGPDSGETLTVVRVGAASHGSVTFSAAEVRYTPHREYTGPDSFSYEISDGHGGSSSALVTVNVGANTDPDAVDDAFETTEDIAIASFNVVANDTDANPGDVLAITAVTQPANGLVTFTPGPGADTVRYEPDADFHGIDTFTYTVSDGHGGTDTATVSVTVTPVNDAPVAVDDQAATLRDTSIDIDVLANDIDVDKCHGCTSIQRGGEFIFFSSDRPAPGSGFFHLWAARPDGSDLVQLTTGDVLDSGVRLRNDGRTLAFTRSVGDVSQIWTLDLVTGQATLLIGAPSVPGNPLFPTWSPDGNSLAFVVNEGTDHDIWVTPYPLVADGFRRVTPDDSQTRTFPSWASNDTVLFQMYATGDIGPSISAVNVVTGTETVIIPTRGGEWYPVLSPDGSTLMWNSERHSTNGDIFVAPYRGAALIPDSEHRRVTSASGYNFMSWAPDGRRIVAETFPVATELMLMNADGTELRALESSPVPAHDPWWAVAARAPLPPGSEETPLQIVALPTVEHGSALLLPSGRVRFTPEPGYVGAASFTYTVSDGEESDTATVSVAVIGIGINAPPVATDDSAETPEDTPRSIDVILNDSDPDADLIVIDAFGTGQHGTVEHDTTNPNVLRYVPSGNFNGSDSFTYTIRDGHGHTSTATVHVTVTAVNDGPVFAAALPDHSVQQGAPDTVINLADFVTDVDIATNGDVLTFSIDHNTNSSVVMPTIVGSTLTLDYGIAGIAQVGIRVADSQNADAFDAFLVSVGTSNQAPIANNDLVETLTNTPVTINVLANDTDPDRDSGAARVVASIPFNPPGVLGNNGSSSGPLAAAPNAPFLYAPGLGGISVIDLNSNALLRIVDAPGLVGANRRAVDSATGLVYFSTTGNAVYAIDARPGSPTLHQVIFSTTIGGNRINDLVVDSARGRLYVMSETFTQTGSTATTSHSRIVVIDANVAAPGFGQTLAVVTVANTIGAVMAVNPTNGDVFVGTTGSNSGVRWLNHQTFVLSPITGVLPVLELVVDAVAGRAYGLSSNGQILAVDLATRTLIANSQLAVPGMVSPNVVQTLRHMAVDPETGRVYLRTNGGPGATGFVFALQPGVADTFWTLLAQVAVGRDSGNDDLVLDTTVDRVITSSGFDHRVDFINTSNNSLDTVVHTRRQTVDLELAAVGASRRLYGSVLSAVVPFTLSPATSMVEVFVGGETGNVVVNPNTHQAFVGWNDTQSRVFALNRDGLVGEVPGGLPNNAGRYLFAMTGVAANQTYVLNTASNPSGGSVLPGHVAVINSAGVIVSTFSAGNQPFGGAINQATGRLHIPAAGLGVNPGGITVIDPATSAVAQVNTSALFTTSIARNIAVVEALGKVYIQPAVVDTNGSNLGVYTEAGLTATRLPTSLGATNVHLIAVNQTTRRVYVGTQAQGQASRILVINANDDSLETTLNLGSQSTTTATQAYIAIDEPRGRIYIADFANDTVHVVDAVTHALLQTLNVGDGPTSLAINRLSNRIYVGSTLDSRLTFIDGATLTVRGALDLPLAPTSLDVDPQQNRIYAAAVRSILPGGSGAMVIADDGAFFTNPLSIAFVSGGVNGTPTLNPDNTITFMPSPGAGFEGRFNYTVTDGELVSEPATVAIFIRPEMSILTEALPPGVVDAPYNVTLETAHAHGVVRWSASGVLPTGLSLSGTGALTGTFLASGTFSFTVRAQDESSPNQVATRTYTLGVGPLTIPPVNPPTGLVGEPYSFTFVAAGATGATTWSVASGSLPPGLTMNASGTISGIPTDVASYPFSVRVTDTASQTAVGNFSILIDGDPVLLDPPVMSELHSTYNFAPYRVGRTPVTLTVFEGTLPSDLTTGTGIISGMPQETGQFPLGLRVTDGRNRLVEGHVTFSAAAADQNLASGGTGATTQAFGPTRRLAQIVTAGVDGLLAGVRSSQLFCSTGDRFTVELRRVTGSNIAVPDENGPPLATAASIVNVNAQIAVQFSNFVAFTAGERFALLFSTTGACEFRNVSAVAMGYQHGYAIESAGGGPWQRIAGANNLAVTTLVQPSSLGYFTEGNYTSPKATTLANGDILITSANGGTANVYSPATGAARRTTGNMVQRRSDYATALLDDGRVLIVGGQFTDAGGQVVRTPHAEVYAGDTFQAVGPLATGRDRPAAMKLPDGRVAIFGGWTGSTSLRSIEIFDPTTNTFSPGGDMVIGRADPEATLLQCPAANPLCSYGGKILITGNVSTPPGELYDSATGTSTALPGSAVVTRSFKHTATQLLDGRVLLVGGGGANHASVGAEVLDVETGSSTAVPASASLRIERHTATRLPDGKVLIIGGRAGDQFETDYRLGVFEFDPVTLGLRGVGRLRGYRAEHDVTTLPDGRLLISGGFGPSGSAVTDDSFEYFTPDPATYFGFTTVVLPAAQQSVAYPTTSLLVSGGVAPYTFTVLSGALPPGLSFVNGTISGTPTAAALGGYTFVVQGADSSAGPLRVSMAFTIRVNGITVTTTTLPGGAIGDPYNAQLLATGTAPFQWSVTSQALPAGLAMSSSGAITGTPTATSAPNFSFRVRVEDATGQVAYRWLFIDIATPLAISDAIVEANPAVLNEEYTLTPYTGGRGPFTLTATGLPRGLSAVDGAISGSPRETGRFEVDLRVVDANGRIDQDIATLDVVAVDQEISGGESGLPQGLSATRRLAQTFTAGADGSLAGIAVEGLTCSSGVFTLRVWNIFGSGNADPGNQAGPPLASASGPGSTMFPGFAVFALQGRPFFRANERFAVVLETTGACQIARVEADETNYILGHAFESTGGGPWQRIAGAADLPVITAIQPVGLQYLTNTFIDDSRISPLGGGQYLITGYNYANVFDPNTGIAQPVAGNMSTGRFAHTATALDDGRVLIVGGRNFLDEEEQNFSYSAQGEVYNAGQFQLAGVMDQGRESHTATKLPDGRVVIIGGWRFAATATTLVASIQVFDPATNTFSSGGALPFGRAEHKATLMVCPTGDPTCAWGGKILVNGGSRAGGPAALIYDPATQISTATTGSPVVSRPNGHSATLLTDGRILFVGGSSVGQAVAELYNPVTGTFAAVNGPPALARYGHAAARLQDGDVLIAGGQLWDQFELGARTDMFRYDFETATFAAAGTLRAKRGFYHSTLLANGRVLLVAGDGSDVSSASVEYYDPNQPAVVISNPVLPNGVPGVAYPTTTLTATGGVPPHTLQYVAGSLPPGLVFNNGTISGLVSGSAAGWYSFTVEARDSSAIPLVAAQTFEIRVTGNLQITTAALPSGSIGVPYAGQLQATGGFPPYRWTLADTRLPGNVTLNSDGSVTGVPNAAESFSPRIRVEDASGQYVWRNVSLTIAGSLQITTTSLPSAVLHDPYTVTLNRSGGQSPFTWSVATGVLPSGVVLSAAGVFSGPSLVAGSFPIEVRVTDGGGSSDLQALTLDVVARDQIVGTATGPTQTFGPARRIAQTLTVGASGALAAIRLNSLFCTAGAITTIEVRPVTGANIAVPDETAAVLATGSTIGVATVGLTPRVQLSVGDRIAVVFTTPGECEIRSTITSTTTHPAGHALESVGGGAWQRIANAQDLPVETRILPANVSYLTTSYFSHRSAPLPNGEILIVGGTSVADIFTPATGASRRTSSGPPFARSGMSATSLNDGSVLITGGAGSPTYPLNSMRYVPTGGGPWFGAGSLAQGRASHTATKLFDGRVVIAGGENPSAPNGSNLSSIEIYDPATDTFMSGGSMLNARDEHHAILLPAGRILMAGGDGPLLVELYSAATQTSTAAGQLLTFRQRGTATLLPDGRVLFIGGTSTLPSAEIYNPATSTSQAVSNSPLLLRFNHTATLQPDGTVIVAGGTLTDGAGNFEDRADVLRFNPNTMTLTGAGSLAVLRRFATAHDLPDGRLLLIGEQSSSNLASRSAEYFDPTQSANFAIATVVLPNGQRNIAYQTTNLEVAGGTAPFTFQILSGSLPPGLTFVNGTISGTPTGAAGGRYTFVVEAAESSPALRRARATLTITINGLQITTTTLPNGSVGQLYSTQLQATGVAPFTWSLTFGTIPSGLTLDASGAITGTPTTVQFGFFGVRVEDAVGQAAARNFSLQVNAAPTPLQITTTTIRDPIAPEGFGWQLQAEGGGGSRTWTLESGTLPHGLSLSAGGDINGNAWELGDFNFTVRVQDSQGGSDTRALSLHVGTHDYQAWPSGPTAPTVALTPVQAVAETFTVSASGTLYGLRADLTCGPGETFTMAVQRVDANGRPDGTTIVSDDGLSVPLSVTVAPRLPWEVVPLPGRKFFPIGVRLAVVMTTTGNCAVRLSDDRERSIAYRFDGGWLPVTSAGSARDLAMSTIIDPDTDLAFTNGIGGDGEATHIFCPAGAPGCTYAEQILITGLNTSLQLYDPATHKTTVTPDYWPDGRLNHTATRLADGRVLVVGGHLWPSLQVFDSAFVYDPQTRTRVTVGSLSRARSNHRAVLLNSGKVLIVGGQGVPDVNGFRDEIREAEVFDPLTNSFNEAGSLEDGRSWTTATLLRCPAATPGCSWDGKVLVFGGYSNDWPLAKGELFDPITQRFTAIPGEQDRSRAEHAAVQLSSGVVMLIGGNAVGFASILDTTEIYDPATNTVINGPQMGGPRMGPAATLLPDDTVLVTGGRTNASGDTTASMERCTAGAGACVGAGSMGVMRTSHEAVRLNDGRIALAGGWHHYVQLSGSTIELYQPASPFAITTTRLPDAPVAEPYDASIDTVGGEHPITMDIVDGALPAGLALQNNAGAFTIHGIPSAPGVFEFTVRASEATGRTSSARLSITVRSSLRVSFGAPAGVFVGEAFDQQLSAFGGNGTAWTFAVEPGFGAPPPGLTLTAAGRLFGTPSAAGSFSWLVRITDNGSPQQSVTRRIRLNVASMDRQQPLVQPEVGIAHVSAFNNLRIAQTAIAGRTGTLRSVRLRAYCTTGHLTVSVYGAQPGAPFLPTEQLTVEGMQGDISPPAAWREVIFQHPVFMRAGDPYAIVINSFNGECNVELAAGTAYAGGSTFVSSWNDPNTWNPYGNPNDFAFATLVEPTELSALGSPTVDGSHAAGEWANAARVNVVMRAGDGEPVPATVLFQNDLENLYMSVVYERSRFEPYTATHIWFDGDNDRDPFEAGEDVVVFNSSQNGFPHFGDLHESHAACAPFTCWEDDVNHGGTSDGMVRYSYSGDTFTIEMRHPIASGDRHDLAASLGSTIGVRLQHLIWEPNDTQFAEFPEFSASPAPWTLAAPADTCVLAPPGLVSWWTGDAAPVGTVADAHGSNNANVLGVLEQTPGRFGNAIRFTGDGRLEAADAASLSPQVGSGGELTVEAWIFRTALPAVSRPIIGKVNSATVREYGLSILPSGAVRFDLYQGSGALHASIVGGLISGGTWHHVVGTYKNGRSARLYVDGVLLAEETSLAGTVADTTASLWIGGNSVEGSFIGAIDEAAIYRREMTPDEVRSLHANGKCRPPTERYTLHVITAGHGSVTSGSAINCGGDCAESYPSGAGVTLTPIAHAFGGVTFTGFSGDCTGLTCTVTMTRDMTVRATFTTNFPPVANVQTVSTPEDTPLPVVLTGSDPEGQPVTFGIVSPPQHGTLSVLSGNQVTYTPDIGFTGFDFFQFDTFDGHFRSGPGFVSIIVTPADHSMFTKSYNAGPGNSENGHSVVANPDGSYVLGRIVEFGSEIEIVVAKVTASGARVWETRLQAPGEQYLQDVIPTADGGYALVAATGNNPIRMLVVKLSNGGLIEWQRLAGSGTDDFLSGSIAEDATGNLYVASTLERASNDVWVAKLTSGGAVVWQKVFGDAALEESVTDLAIVADGPMIVGARSAGLADGFLLHLDADGLRVSYRMLATTNSDAPQAIVAVPGGGYVLAGTIGTRPWIARFNADHTVAWMREILTTGITRIDSLAIRVDGLVVLSGALDTSTETPPKWAIALFLDGSVAFQSQYGDSMGRETAVAAAIDAGFVIVGMQRGAGSSFDTILIKTDSLGLAGCGLSSNTAFATAVPNVTITTPAGATTNASSTVVDTTLATRVGLTSNVAQICPVP